MLGNIGTDMQTDSENEKQTEAKYGYTKGPKDRKTERKRDTVIHKDRQRNRQEI